MIIIKATIQKIPGKTTAETLAEAQTISGPSPPSAAGFMVKPPGRRDLTPFTHVIPSPRPVSVDGCTWCGTRWTCGCGRSGWMWGCRSGGSWGVVVRSTWRPGSRTQGAVGRGSKWQSAGRGAGGGAASAAASAAPAAWGSNRGARRPGGTGSALQQATTTTTLQLATRGHKIQFNLEQFWINIESVLTTIYQCWFNVLWPLAHSRIVRYFQPAIKSS